jgi:hypothetical protein
MVPFLRVVLNFVVGGALAGVLVVSALAPRLLAWDNSVPDGKALCECSDKARQTADKVINWQMTGLAVGSGVGLLAAIAYRMLRKKRNPAPSATA